MTKDRLEAFKAARAQYESEDFVDVTISDDADGRPMEEFFEHVEAIRGGIEAIQVKVEAVKKKHSEILANPVNDARTKEELDDLMAEIKRTATGVRDRLKTLEKHVQKEEQAGVATADLRIRKSQCVVLSRKFFDVMTAHNGMQADYRKRCKERIQRQLEIAGREVTTEELDEMIESDEPRVFTQMIIADTQLARQTLADIEARHNDIIKLEQSILELNNMFTDIAMFVDNQGTMVDRIDFNVEQAKDFVAEAAADTKQAVSYKVKARKKKICLISTGIVVLIVIIAVIVVVLIVHFNSAKAVTG